VKIKNNIWRLGYIQAGIHFFCLKSAKPEMPFPILPSLSIYNEYSGALRGGYAAEKGGIW
jgi:hypothetical protein